MRNKVIDEVLSEAKAKIMNLPDKEYSDFLFNLFNNNAQPLDGVLRFVPADYARLSEGFLQRCRQAFPDHDLQISGDMEGIVRGFVIQYGNILINCSIDSIFESEGQVLRDRIYEVLVT